MFTLQVYAVYEVFRFRVKLVADSLKRASQRYPIVES